MVIWHLKQIGRVKIGGCLMRKWKWSHSVVSNSSWPQGPSMGFSMQEYWSGLPLLQGMKEKIFKSSFWSFIFFYSMQWRTISRLWRVTRSGFYVTTSDEYLCGWTEKKLQSTFQGQIEFSSLVQSCPTLCDPMDCSTPGFPDLHQLPELPQTHVNWVRDAIQPSHPLSPPSPPAFNLSNHRDLFQWVSSSHQVAKLLEIQLQHQSFQWIFRTNFL